MLKDEFLDLLKFLLVLGGYFSLEFNCILAGCVGIFGHFVDSHTLSWLNNSSVVFMCHLIIFNISKNIIMNEI